jgi:nucleoside-diphosphate-sugar epimerase
VIGAWALRSLVDAGHETVGLNRGMTTVGNGILGDRAKQMEWVRCDLLDGLAVASVVKRTEPDVIAHLASAKPWQMDVGFVPRPDPPLGVHAIVDGTLNLLESARLLGVGRVVYASSKAAYGDFAGPYTYPAYQPVPEDYPPTPDSIYGITKLCAEQLGLYYRDHLGVDFVALRLAATYGPFKRGSGNTPNGLIGAAAEGRVSKGRFSEHEYYEEKEELVYNRDVGEAFRLACEAEPTRDAVFNIGSGALTTVAEVVEAIKAVPQARQPDIEIVENGRPAREPGARSGHCLFDETRAAQQLGFEPSYDLAAGVADTVDVVAAAASR